MSKRKRLVAEINVVPYIDVMLVLLVIFMVTAPLLTQGVQVNLPKATAKAIDSKSKEPIIVSVDASGQYYLNVSSTPDAPIAANEMIAKVASELQISTQQGQVRQVLIKGDKDVDYGKVVTAMVSLQQAGVENVGLITDGAGAATPPLSTSNQSFTSTTRQSPLPLAGEG